MAPMLLKLEAFFGNALKKLVEVCCHPQCVNLLNPCPFTSSWATQLNCKRLEASSLCNICGAHSRQKGCWHNFLDTWDPAVSWHLRRAIYWPHCNHHPHWLLTTLVRASNCSLTIAHPTTSQHNNHAFCSLNWSVHNSRRQQKAKLLNLYDYFSVPLLMFRFFFMQLVTMWLQIKLHNISLLSLQYTSRWEDEQMYVLARHKIIPTP